MSDAYERPKRGLLARLVRLVIGAGLLAGIGLFAGYKLQAGKWAWEDVDGFVTYAKQTTRTGYRKARSLAVRTNDRYRITDRTKALLAKAKQELARLMEGEKKPPVAGTASAPSAAEIEAQREANFGFTDAELEQLPPGYFEAYKSGLEAYRDALQAFRASMPGTPEADAHLREAKQRFEQARAAWEKARAAYPDDGRVEQLLQQVQEYLHDINKRMTVG
ncbi:MAG: hypothetical protein D6776_06215 [Planctomycetota bacterium]|nr:MAG: hypothetical protein D6776_06215 [Planctomycetota bacterium]